MSVWMDLAKRHREPEIMDDPALDEQRHLAALRGLERVNRWSRSANIVWGAISGLARQSSREGLSLLDIATGAGDVPIRLSERARRAGLKLSIDACDLSATALKHARRRANSTCAGVRFFRLDALREELPARYDVLICSLFLHHLSEEQTILFLRRMGKAAGRLVVVNDLLRSPAGVTLAYVGSRLLTTSSMVHVDAVRSVRAAYTLPEIRALADGAGLHGAAIKRRWPCRFLMTWQQSGV